jgi:hypothetical protein
VIGWHWRALRRVRRDQSECKRHQAANGSQPKQRTPSSFSDRCRTAPVRSWRGASGRTASTSRSTSRIQALHRNDRKRLGGSSSPSGRVTTCVKHSDHIDRCICFAKKCKIGKAAEKRPARLMGRGGELPRVLGNSSDDYAQRVSKLRRNLWRMRLVPIQCVVEIRPRVGGEPNAQHS